MLIIQAAIDQLHGEVLTKGLGNKCLLERREVVVPGVLLEVRRKGDLVFGGRRGRVVDVVEQFEACRSDLVSALGVGFLVACGNFVVGDRRDVLSIVNSVHFKDG